MSRLRYFLAAALVAESMAVCAGAADTADRDALLETAVTHLQQQWQTSILPLMTKPMTIMRRFIRLCRRKTCMSSFFR